MIVQLMSFCFEGGGEGVSVLHILPFHLLFLTPPLLKTPIFLSPFVQRVDDSIQ